MPEGPEVKTMSDNLNSRLQNKEIIEINYLRQNKVPNNYIFLQSILPLRVKEINAKGKMLYFLFDKHIYMIITLGMTGIWSLEKHKHTTLEIKYLDNNKEKSVYFVDVRKFGKIYIYKHKEEFEKKLDSIGPDLLNRNDFNFDLFKDILMKKKHWNITKALMDQSLMSGIGNYLKSEILYASKISPHRNIEDLSGEELKTLYTQARKIIKKSYELGGLSAKDFVNIEGKEGKSYKLIKVYCMDKIDGKKIKREKTKDGRTTHWVPEVQV